MCVTHREHVRILMNFICPIVQNVRRILYHALTTIYPFAPISIRDRKNISMFFKQKLSMLALVFCIDVKDLPMF